jgi:hypothetical protein
MQFATDFTLQVKRLMSVKYSRSLNNAQNVSAMVTAIMTASLISRKIANGCTIHVVGAGSSIVGANVQPI